MNTELNHGCGEVRDREGSISKTTTIDELKNRTYHFVENRRIVVFVLDGHFDGAHVVQMRVPVVRGSYRQVHFFVPSGFVSVERLRAEVGENRVKRTHFITPSCTLFRNSRFRDTVTEHAVLTSRVVISPVCASMENLERSLGPLTNVYVMVPPLSGGSLSNALTYKHKKTTGALLQSSLMDVKIQYIFWRHIFIFINVALD